MDSEDTRKDAAVPACTAPAHGLYRDIETVHSGLDQLVTAECLSDVEGATLASSRVVDALVGGALVLRRLQSQPNSAVHIALGTVLLRGACHATLHALDTYLPDGSLAWQSRVHELRGTAVNIMPPVDVGPSWNVLNRGLRALGIARDGRGDSPFATGLPRDAVAALKGFLRQIGGVARKLGELETAIEGSPYPAAIRAAEAVNVEWGVLAGFRGALEFCTRDRRVTRSWVQPALVALRAATTTIIAAGSERAAPSGSAAQALRRQLRQLEMRMRNSGADT